MSDTILIVGASGLVGSQVVRQLITEGRDKSLHLLLRRACPQESGAAQVHIADKAQWPDIIASIEPDIVISALGSTMKKAGSKEAFAAIDRDLVAAVAQASKQAGARHFITISSAMANANSSTFYLKIKGETEKSLTALNFTRLDIFRPGLLRGERHEDQRPGERIAIAFSPVMDILMRGPFKKFRSISARNVAKAIICATENKKQGVYFHNNDEIDELAAMKLN